MMFTYNSHKIRQSFLGVATMLGVLSVGLIGYSFTSEFPMLHNIEGRLLPQQLRKEQVWETISAEEMREGDTIQPHINTIIFVPDEVTRITRRTLFGRTGDRVRYWGYCFPQSYEEMEALKRRGFPGTVFLSEKEREFQNNTITSKRESAITSFNQLTEENLNNSQPRQYSAIRHQQEIFTGGMVCYVMTNEAIPIGVDEDDDGANTKVEIDHGSDPKKADTDGDGIRDGLEIFYLGTIPNKRDSDGDGIIDGIEDFNRNGRIDAGESNPMVWDTDRDGLCDGLCLVNNGKDLRGEDKNLNGILDEGETSPVLVDTDGDGILDEQEYYNCVLEGSTDC